MYKFLGIPQDENDPRNVPELINLCNVDIIRFMAEDRVMLHFSNKEIRLISGDRAKVFIEQLKGQLPDKPI